MYAKLLAVVAVLCMGATSFAGLATIEIQNLSLGGAALGQNWTYKTTIPRTWLTKPDTPVLSFDIVLTGLDNSFYDAGYDAKVLRAAAVDFGFRILGPGSEHLMANPTYNQYYATDNPPTTYASGTYDFAVFTAGDYAYWTWVGTELTNSQAGGQGLVAVPSGELMTWVFAAGSGQNADVFETMILARVFYAWDGVMFDVNNLQIQVTNSSGVGDAFARSGSGENTALIIPEPATMGLLGLGLVGLVARRRGRK